MGDALLSELLGHVVLSFVFDHDVAVLGAEFLGVERILVRIDERNFDVLRLIAVLLQHVLHYALGLVSLVEEHRHFQGRLQVFDHLHRLFRERMHAVLGEIFLVVIEFLREHDRHDDGEEQKHRINDGTDAELQVLALEKIFVAAWPLP